MPSFLRILFVIGLGLAALGGLSWASALGNLSHQPAIIAVPQVLTAETVCLLGLILAAISGGAIVLTDAIHQAVAELRTIGDAVTIIAQDVDRMAPPKPPEPKFIRRMTDWT